jgi:hypothetical protein
MTETQFCASMTGDAEESIFGSSGLDSLSA